VWQLSHELKVAIDAFVESGPITLERNAHLYDRLRRSASHAPQSVAEGFTRYLPGDFVRHLQRADAELSQTLDGLRVGCERGCFTEEEVAPLRRLATRAATAITALVRYLKMAEAAAKTRPTQSHRPREKRAAASGVQSYL
jgi:four helix bundle protein